MKNFFKSLFTDGDWDGDFTKVFGFLIIVAGVVGFFLALPEWAVMVGLGGAMATTGKFSPKG